jgi:transposase-like protein
MPKTTAISAPQFTNEQAAIAHVEASRWPDGVNCPHCGSVTVTRMGGKTQAGMFLCNDCREKFTCRTGTVMERSHIPIHKWLLAIHLLNCGKNGASSHELHRMLGITYKSAWFLSHRIREAMKDAARTPMGGEGQIIQADETYYGNSSKRSKSYRKGHRHKAGIVALVDPKGRARAFHVKPATAKAVREILVTNVAASPNCTPMKAIFTPRSDVSLPHTKLSSMAAVTEKGFTSVKMEQQQTQSKISSAILSAA